MRDKILLAAILSCSTMGPLSAATLDPTGNGVPFSISQPSQEISAYIRTHGSIDRIGELYFHAGTAGSFGTAANGQVLSIAQNQALFSKIGTTYGGNGITTFRVPDLRGRAIAGVSDTRPLGTVTGATEHTLALNEMPSHTHTSLEDGEVSSSTGGSQSFSIEQPSIAMHYDVVTQGLFPTSGTGTGGDVSTLGYVSVDASNDNAFGDVDRIGSTSSLLPINSNPALFSIVGASYGGDGATTFGVPDLADRLVRGAGGTAAPGSASEATVSGAICSGLATGLATGGAASGGSARRLSWVAVSGGSGGRPCAAVSTGGSAGVPASGAKISGSGTSMSSAM